MGVWMDGLIAGMNLTMGSLGGVEGNRGRVLNDDNNDNNGPFV